MSRVKSRNTSAEKQVRSLIHRMGFRFRLHVGDLPGEPDIVLPGRGKVVFVHGCFWHQHRGCRRSQRPSTNTEFWNAKLDGNTVRDARVQRQLRRLGWSVMVVWECELKDRDRLRRRIAHFLGER